MPPPAVPTNRAKRVFCRFGRNRRGSAAVEFALIAPVFFALLFAILETGIMFFADQYLETLAQNAARQVLTLQAQTAGYANVSAFKTAVVCNNQATVLFFSCANIYVDVENYTSFSTATISTPITSCAFDPSHLGYNPGGAGATVIVTLYYQWPLFVTGLGYNMSNLCGSNQRLLQATAVFQNEP